MTALRDAFPILLLACACGASLRTDPDTRHGQGLDGGLPRAAIPARDAEDTAAGDPRAEALRVRGAAFAPGMRLVTQRKSREAEVDLVHAEAQDECIRVAYDAAEAITVELTNAKGEVLARNAAPASAGVLPLAGPVCVRRGDAIAGIAVHAADAGAGAGVLWAAWAAP